MKSPCLLLLTFFCHYSFAEKIDIHAFRQILERLETLYRPDVARLGKKLQILEKWSLSANADIKPEGEFWTIMVGGGLARKPLMTADGIAGVVCHELGHLLGGFPKREVRPWSSEEGQSDYFATAKCLKRYFQGQDNRAAVAALEIPELVVQKCRENFFDEESVLICQRSSMAGLSMALTLAMSEGWKWGRPKLEAPVARPKHVSVEKWSTLSHCRLQIYFQGSLCNRPFDESFSDTDYRVGACTREDGYSDGVRPACWFTVTTHTSDHLESQLRYRSLRRAGRTPQSLQLASPQPGLNYGPLP